MPERIRPEHITGLVLAGGRGSRMGGVDKGLQLYQGRPLAEHAMQRLAPQVGQGRLLLNANRNLPAYAALGASLCPDVLPGFPGPLAGFLAGLERCETDWLVTVPCDTPAFPLDLVARLAQAATQAGALVAVAATVAPPPAPATTLQPVFCLLHLSLRGSLAAFLASGQGQIARWVRQQPHAVAVFEEADAFFNANTPQDLQSLHALRGA